MQPQRPGRRPSEIDFSISKSQMHKSAIADLCWLAALAPQGDGTVASPSKRALPVGLVDVVRGLFRTAAQIEPGLQLAVGQLQVGRVDVIGAVERVVVLGD